MNSLRGRPRHRWGVVPALAKGVWQAEVRFTCATFTNPLFGGMFRRWIALDCNEIGDMEVRYEDGKLRKLCTDEREMRRSRSDIAPKLRLRIRALETATTVGELSTHDPLGWWHQLHANLEGLWAGKLSANQRLLVRPDGADDPADAVIVTVIDIDDYH